LHNNEKEVDARGALFKQQVSKRFFKVWPSLTKLSKIAEMMLSINQIT